MIKEGKRGSFSNAQCVTQHLGDVVREKQPLILKQFFHLKTNTQTVSKHKNVFRMGVKGRVGGRESGGGGGGEGMK